MKLFTATKQIESITIHYNERLDGGFVRQLEEYIIIGMKGNYAIADIRNWNPLSADIVMPLLRRLIDEGVLPPPSDML